MQDPLRLCGSALFEDEQTLAGPIAESRPTDALILAQAPSRDSSASSSRRAAASARRASVAATTRAPSLNVSPLGCNLAHSGGAAPNLAGDDISRLALDM